MKGFLSKILPSRNDRLIRSLMGRCEEINRLEESLASKSDADIQTAFLGLRERRIEKAEPLDHLLHEAFALVREASKRTIGLRHFDVQLLGGIVLHQGKITEMKTGEGKTLVATLAASLNALDGKGVHIVTVNDYLARRDASWMGQIYHFLGLTTGVVNANISDVERREAYSADITYCTNNELGFDYLRDHLKMRLDDMVLRDSHYAIIDEVDSILIDEARTPLIISGPSSEKPDLYTTITKIVKALPLTAFEKEEKFRTIMLTESGINEVEKILVRHKLMAADSSLFDPQNMTLVHHINQALRAYHLFRKDHDYIVEDRQVIIIDEFTGRKMAGRRYSDGLHQALEAKEGVSIQQENQTYASITYQNLFRQYEKLAGMTGTALTEMQEFGEIYNLDVVDVPTNQPMARLDENDAVYRTSIERDKAVVREIKKAQENLQPVLVGTVSIERSEQLSKMLKKEKITHQVLNARNHEAEALIIAEAGRPGKVTIATNMAGRGTDIQLGGNVDMMLGSAKDEAEQKALRMTLEDRAQQEKKDVLSAGGLLVLGTERHESRRIDNQLRGRSGRQGDPGRSCFFISLEDDLMRIFGSERIDSLLKQVGLEEDEAIVHSWIDKAIERAQQKVETHNFDIRKQLLKFDDVVNDQRKAIFEERRDLMAGYGIVQDFTTVRDGIASSLVEEFMPPSSLPAQWDLASLETSTLRIFNIEVPIKEWGEEEGVDGDIIISRIKEKHDAHLASRRQDIESSMVKEVEQTVALQILDLFWKDHLQQLDHLRQGIGLRAYGQRDPLNEFRQEAFTLFEHMLSSVNEHTITMISHLSFEHRPSPAQQHKSSGKLSFGRNYNEKKNADDPSSHWHNTPRNSPCPCGSGKKYKHCHGKLS